MLVRVSMCVCVYVCVRVGAFLLQQLTAASIVGGVEHLLQDPAEVERKPAESEDHHQTEDGLRYLPPLGGEGRGL